MSTRMLARLLVVGMLAVPAGGCSLLFVSGPPRQHAEMNYFTCTLSNFVPALDAIWAGLNGLGAGIALTSSDVTVEDRGQTILVGTGWFLLSGYSAYMGFQRTGACRAATEQLFLRQSRSGMGTGLPDPAWVVMSTETETPPGPEPTTSLLERRPAPFPVVHPVLRTAAPEWRP